MVMSTCRWRLFSRSGLFLLAAVLPWLSQAQSLAKPEGPVILTISGNITHKNSANAAVFDAAMVDALAVSQVKTSAFWRKGLRTFTGPSLQSVLALVGAKGQSLRLIALDNYEVRVPVQDVTQFNPVLARKIDGVSLKVKDRGPLFLIYPFDDLPELKSDVYYSRSVWHLTQMVVE